MTFLGIAESFKMMNPARPDPVRFKPDPAAPCRSLTAYFSESMKDRDVQFLQNLYSSLKFMILRFGIDIFDSFEIMPFSAT